MKLQLQMHNYIIEATVQNITFSTSLSLPQIHLFVPVMDTLSCSFARLRNLCICLALSYSFPVCRTVDQRWDFRGIKSEI